MIIIESNKFKKNILRFNLCFKFTILAFKKGQKIYIFDLNCLIYNLLTVWNQYFLAGCIKAPRPFLETPLDLHSSPPTTGQLVYRSTTLLLTPLFNLYQLNIMFIKLYQVI